MGKLYLVTLLIEPEINGTLLARIDTMYRYQRPPPACATSMLYRVPFDDRQDHPRRDFSGATPPAPTLPRTATMVKKKMDGRKRKRRAAMKDGSELIGLRVVLPASCFVGPLVTERHGIVKVGGGGGGSSA